MSILEPFVEIKAEPQFELDFTRTKKWSTNLTINYKKVHLLLNMSTPPYHLLVSCIKGEKKVDSKFCEVCHIRKEQKCHMGSWRLMGSWKSKD